MKYFTNSRGIGGRIRQRIEDFQVEEIPPRESEYKFDHKGHSKKDDAHPKVSYTGLEELQKKEQHTVFWMEKFNWDTHQAIRRIAKKLHVSPTRFGIAGTKDRRAVTRQRVSVWGIGPEKIEWIGLKDIKLYNASLGRRVELGDLDGNKFTIIIRDISLSKEETRNRIEKIFLEINEKGIPNLFGPQRFGEVRKVTDKVGLEILRGNIERAAKIYLAEVFEGEREDSIKARMFLKENWNKYGFLKSMELFPERLKYERSMLDYLYKNPSDFWGALQKLPEKLRKMFLNAVQSRIFNSAAEILYTKNIRIPLPGFDSKLNSNDPAHKIIIEEMKKMGIKLNDFSLSHIKNMKVSGGERMSLLKPKYLSIDSIDSDEFNEGKLKVKISFALPSGSYATVVLSEIIK